jgi:AcrR family transcriptional regulator
MYTVVSMSAQPQTGLLRVLPRGRHAAPREVVMESQRSRMLGAMAGAVAEKGYARVAVADVIERAGVSRKTFYEHFANKEDCFLAAYDEGVGLLLGAIDEAVREAAPDWLAAAEAGARCYLDNLAANPDFARTFLLEVLAAGPAALERRTAVLRRFADQLALLNRAARADLAELPEPPGHVYLACVGAINEMVSAHLLAHGAERLGELAPAVVDVQLALLVGRDLGERLRPASGDLRARRAQA